MRRRVLFEACSWSLIISLGIVSELIMIPQARAASGQTTLYFHKEPSDDNEAYNAMLPSPAEPGSYTPSSTTSTTNVNAAPPSAMCESAGNTGETFNQVSASAASTGNRCMATFISPPVGQTITISTSDTLTINMYSSVSASQATVTPEAYLYQLSGTTLTNIATFTGTGPGTTATLYTGTANPGATVTSLSATDRLVVILAENVTKSHVNATVSSYFDNNTLTTPADIIIPYTYTTPGLPTLTGTGSDAFQTAKATTSCAGNPSLDSIWTCNAPVAANSGGSFNDEDAIPTASAGDTTHWLWLSDSCGSGTAACTPSNFGTTPSNTFLSETLPTGYGDGQVQTAVSSSMAYTVGATSPSAPYNHVGLVLWTSNTDYLEIQAYSNAVKGTANTTLVGLNNSGTIGTTAFINTTVSNGLYNLLWLGFTKTGTSYQAQYSTNGSTWTNLGTAVTHSTAFSQVGLNAFCATAISTAATDYGGAFNYFYYTFAAPPGPTVTQRMRDGLWWSGGTEQNFWLN